MRFNQKLFSAITITAGLLPGLVSAKSTNDQDLIKDLFKEGKKKAQVETIADAARKAQRLAGTAVSEGVLYADLQPYTDILNSEFDYITPENTGKWGELQPDSAYEWNFDQHDPLLDYAMMNRKVFKGHTLVWHSQAPSFINDTLSAAELQDVIQQHIDTTMGRYAGQIYAWDVVNEAIAEDGTYRDSVFYRTLGESYIADAFHSARANDSLAKLYYNDYNIAGINAKSNGVYNLLKGLVNAKVPVTGIGFQMHLTASSAPGYDELVANFKRFADLGLNINVSELDVRVSDLPWDDATKLAIQRQVYHRVVSACMAFKTCESVTTWGFTDAYSWIDSTFGADDPLLFNEQYQKKPAYYGMVDGFMNVRPAALGSMPNLIANSHFETGVDGWQSWGGTLKRSLLEWHDGISALMVSGRTATWNGPAYDVTGLVRAGQSYTARAQVRIDNNKKKYEPVTLNARYRCEGGSDQYLDLGAAQLEKKTWTPVTGVLELPDCDLEEAVFYISGPAAGVDLYVDAASLQPQTLVPDATGLGPNIIQNADFEVDAFGWYGFGSAMIDVSANLANSGTQSGYVTARDASWQGPATSLALDAMPGAEYQLLAWVQPEAGATLINATLNTKCVSGDQYNTVAQVSASAGVWSVLSGTFTVPNCDYTDLVLYFEGPAAGVNFYIDDVYVREIPSVDLPDNLIPNGSFESGVDGWSAWGGSVIASSTDFARTGSRSALLYNRSGTWQGPVYNLLPIVMAGETYSVNAWGRVAGAAQDSMNITVKTVCSSGAENYHQLDSVVANDSGWTELDGSITLPDCGLTEVSLYFDGAAAGVDVYLDDVVVLGATNAGPANLVTNPGFEAGTNDWSTWGGVLTATTADAYSGSQSALHSGRTANWQGPVYNLLPHVTAGATYDFSAWGKIAGLSTSTMGITVKTTCAESGENYQQTGSTAVNDSDWTQLSGSLTLPACTLTEVSMYFDGPEAQADILLDDVSVVAAQQ